MYVHTRYFLDHVLSNIVEAMLAFNYTIPKKEMDTLLLSTIFAFVTMSNGFDVNNIVMRLWLLLERHEEGL